MTVLFNSRAIRRRLSRRWLARFLLAGILAIGMGYLPYRAYGPGGVPRALRLEGELADLLRGNQRLKADNRQLRQRIRRLKDDLSAIEQVARDELGLVRDEDIVFQFE